ncbi:hypothetical protein J2W96_007879, partial [Variovorax guangxiensis]|nr:hypothetical protein [Variovorax guangxiensis]
MVIGDLMSEPGHLQERIAQSEHRIRLMARQNDKAQQLMQLRGIGPTTATAIVASIGNGLPGVNCFERPLKISVAGQWPGGFKPEAQQGCVSGLTQAVDGPRRGFLRTLPG